MEKNKNNQKSKKSKKTFKNKNVKGFENKIKGLLDLGKEQAKEFKDENIPKIENKIKGLLNLGKKQAKEFKDENIPKIENKIKGLLVLGKKQAKEFKDENVPKVEKAVKNLFAKGKEQVADWYNQGDENESCQCYYCGISEDDLKNLWKQNKQLTKAITRGKVLQKTSKTKDKKTGKTKEFVLTCYWCNNAKGDTFTETEFKSIGKSIRKVWQERLREK